VSDSHSAESGPPIALTIEEVQGVFPSDARLQDAIARLTQFGFDRADLSLPDTAMPPSQATPERGAETASTEADMRQARTLGAGLAGAVGVMAASGVTIATGGAAAAAAAAAAVAGLGAGVLAKTAGDVADAARHEAREQAAREGRLVLAARITSPDRQVRAEQAMKDAGAIRVASVRRTDASIDSAAWTG
jgi:hypothetical protein